MPLDQEQCEEAIEKLHQCFIAILEKHDAQKFSWHDVLNVVGNYVLSEMEHCFKITKELYPNDKEAISRMLDDVDEFHMRTMSCLEKYERNLQ